MTSKKSNATFASNLSAKQLRAIQGGFEYKLLDVVITKMPDMPIDDNLTFTPKKP